MEDLFDYPEKWTPELRAVLEKHADMDETYENCAKLQADLQAIGYDIEWYLNAIPYNLHKL